MMNSRTVVESLSSSDLRSATWDLVRRSHGLDAALLVHLGEIEQRKLYLDWSFSSMFAYCVEELGFSEDVACNRINVARAARRMPIILEVLRSGKVHLAGLRLLAPHLTIENQEKVLAEATGKSTRQIEALVARLAPQPSIPTIIRKLPSRNSALESATLSFGIADVAAPPDSPPALALVLPTAPAPRRDERRAPTPLSDDTFKFQFTATRACHDKFRQAQDLLRHRVPNGDVATIFEKALDLVIEQMKKERFGAGRKPRQGPTEDAKPSCSRHSPDAKKREAYERDGARCLIIGHFAHASRRVPGARERALRARGQITLASPLLFRGESSATAARISRRAQAAAAVAARSADESRCVWPISSRPDAPTLGQSISRARAPAGTLPSVTHAPGSDRSGLDT